MQEIKNFIGGQFVPSVSGEWLPDIEPATGKVFAHLTSSTARDVEAAVEAAAAAQQKWAETDINTRSRYLLAMAQGIEDRQEKFARAESLDTGKPITLATRMDIARAIANFRFFATAILHESRQSYHDQGILNYTTRQPLGVVGCISPWNLPLYLFSWKVAPALAAGCTVVGKPSEFTPLTASMLGEVCQKVGLPDGVLNIVQGIGSIAGQAIVEHPDIKAISFTGGTATGRKIAATAAPAFKKLSLELGGKNATVVFADSDLKLAVEQSIRAAFTNQGQICLCGSRILIESSIYEKFKSEFVAQASRLVVGDPNDPQTQIGALISAAHTEKVLSYIQLAKEEGGTLLLGGERMRINGRCSEGYFVQPTVFEGLSVNCRTNQEEIFGPVVTLMPFDNEQQALQWTNSTPYGLSCSIWTKDLERAHRFSRMVKAGVIWVNCWLVRDLRTPFGGMKQSGMGREGGFYALDFFTELQNICIKW